MPMHWRSTLGSFCHCAAFDRMEIFQSFTKFIRPEMTLLVRVVELNKGKPAADRDGCGSVAYES